MMTREEVVEIMTYCQDHSMSYKEHLAELGIPCWKFYDSKGHYAKEQHRTSSSAPEFLQLSSSGAFVPIPSFAPSNRRSKAKSGEDSPNMMSIELRTQSGTVMRILGEFTAAFLKSVIQGMSPCSARTTVCATCCTTNRRICARATTLKAVWCQTLWEAIRATETYTSL